MRQLEVNQASEAIKDDLQRQIAQMGEREDIAVRTLIKEASTLEQLVDEMESVRGERDKLAQLCLAEGGNLGGVSGTNIMV